MTTKNCLNCEKELIDKYCHGCGQKADTHRITFKNFIFHDVLHGTFHFEKGMLFTAKEALIRPGKSALDYISGKRIRYYNVFYLTLITFGLLLFIRHFLENVDLNEVGEVIPKKPSLNEASEKMEEIFSQKSKIIIFLFVPFAALNSLLLFKSKKLNLSEHAVLAGMILLGMLLIALFGNLFFYLDVLFPFGDTFSAVMSWVVMILITGHIGYGYFNAFGNDYTKFGIAYRIILFYVLICSEIMLLFLLVWGMLTHWEFGTVRVNPF